MPQVVIDITLIIHHLSDRQHSCIGTSYTTNGFYFETYIDSDSSKVNWLPSDFLNFADSSFLSSVGQHHLGSGITTQNVFNGNGWSNVNPQYSSSPSGWRTIISGVLKYSQTTGIQVNIQPNQDDWVWLWTGNMVYSLSLNTGWSVTGQSQPFELFEQIDGGVPEPFVIVYSSIGNNGNFTFPFDVSHSFVVRSIILLHFLISH